MFLIRRDALKFKEEVGKGTRSFFSGLGLGCEISFQKCVDFQSSFLFAALFVFLRPHIRAALPEWLMLQRSALFFQTLTSGVLR